MMMVVIGHLARRHRRAAAAPIRAVAAALSVSIRSTMRPHAKISHIYRAAADRLPPKRSLRDRDRRSQVRS